MSMPIYLDYNSTSPVDPIVLKEMLPTFTETYGNPSSENHSHGEKARTLVELARQRVAKLVNMSPSDVIFTSGATEANNLALRSMISSLKINVILVGATEHKSILDTAEAISNENKSINVVKIPVDENGFIDEGTLALNLDYEEDNILVSVMAANSETGVLNPMKSIVEIVHHAGWYLHCDATQAVGRIEFDVDALGIDMVSISSHKIYGPKGAGALIATRNMRKMMQPMLHGGGQEDSMRSGTLNVPSIVGFGKACEIALKQVTGDSILHQKSLRDHLEKQILLKIPDSRVNGKVEERIPNTTNIHFIGADADAVMSGMRYLSVSSGSACASSTMEPSHVLTAMGLTFDEADESIRFSVGRQTTKEEIDSAIDMIVDAVSYVRKAEGYITTDKPLEIRNEN